MSEEEKGSSGGREQGLAEAASSVRALRESLKEEGASPSEGVAAVSGQAKESAAQVESSGGKESAAQVASAAGEGAAPAESKAGAAGKAGAAQSAGTAQSAGKASAAAGLGAAVVAASSSGATRSAAGSTRELEDELDDDDVSRELRGGSWRRFAALGLLVAVALGIGAVVLLGQRNGERYLLRCAAEHIVAEHGRGFPPWGERRLSGKQWKPILLPLAAECRTRQAQSEVELAGWYAEALMEQAGQVLASGKLDQLEAAAAQLEQAALLTRAPERRAERAQLQRLWGDVEYGRALAKLAEARQALAEAARGLDEAAKKEPRYATDAAARARELRRLLAELGAPGVAEAGAPVSPLPAPSANEDSSAAPPAIPEVPTDAISTPGATEPGAAGPATPASTGDPTGPAPAAQGEPPPAAPGDTSGTANSSSTPPPAPAAPTPAPVPAGGVLL